MFAAMHLFL